MALLENGPVLHMHLEGSRFDLPLNDLEIRRPGSDQDVRRTLANYVGVSEVRFHKYVVHRHRSGDVTVCPEAV